MIVIHHRVIGLPRPGGVGHGAGRPWAAEPGLAADRQSAGGGGRPHHPARRGQPTRHQTAPLRHRGGPHGSHRTPTASSQDGHDGPINKPGQPRGVEDNRTTRSRGRQWQPYGRLAPRGSGAAAPVGRLWSAPPSAAISAVNSTPAGGPRVHRRGHLHDGATTDTVRFCTERHGPGGDHTTAGEGDRPSAELAVDMTEVAPRIRVRHPPMALE
jgi:hypothetical protein